MQAPSASGQQHEAEDILQQLGSLLCDSTPAHQRHPLPPGLANATCDLIRLDLQLAVLSQDREAPAASRENLSASTSGAIDTLTQGTAACADIQALKHRVHTHLHSTHTHHALPVARDKQAAFQQALAAAATASASQQGLLELADWSSQVTDAPTSWNTSLYSSIELGCQVRARLELMREVDAAATAEPAH